MTNYADVDELKRLLKIEDSDQQDDDILLRVLTTVSAFIENHCGQRFWTTSADETRTFTPTDDDWVWVGPLLSITTLTVDDLGYRTYPTTWAATDYDLWPENAALDGKPYYKLLVTPNGRYEFPRVAKGVKIVGKFGWLAVPAPVKEACLLQAVRTFKRPDAPFGVLGSADMGYSAVISQLDPDVARMLDGYVL